MTQTSQVDFFKIYFFKGRSRGLVFTNRCQMTLKLWDPLPIVYRGERLTKDKHVNGEWAHSHNML